MVIPSLKKFYLKLFRLFSIALACLLIFTAKARCENINLGVVFNGNPVQTFKTWQPLAKYLSQQIGINVKVVPMNYDTFVKWLKSDKPGIAICNQAIFSFFKDSLGLKPIAIPVWNVRGQPIHQYGAVLFTKAGSPVKSISDVTGKIVAIPHKYSLAALLGLKTLEDLGVPLKSIASVKTVKTHFNVVYGVINGAADVGIVRTGILEQMSDLKKLEIKSIFILNRKTDDFPYVHSTELVPEWFLCLTRKLEAKMSTQIQTALYEMNANTLAATQMKLLGWKNPAEFIGFKMDRFLAIQKSLP